jgi:hypothetical protein
VQALAIEGTASITVADDQAEKRRAAASRKGRATVPDIWAAGSVAGGDVARGNDFAARPAAAAAAIAVETA